MLLFGFLQRTALGVAIQASSQNQLASYLCGVRVKRLNSLVWAISGAIAALCGVLLAPISLVDLGLWFVVLKDYEAELETERATEVTLREDFQKKLWLKKKFVVSAHWCVTLDRVPTSSDADAPLQRMVEAIKGGTHGAYIPFDRQGQPVNFS